ncbi:hypothetical protein AAG570_011433 [Ranatra chinensis]|uniref:26S proteasome non-ATPase regulatory subunit 5 n=1 Tax=Ranatra chinensis TaxID=642074 RepID=A0ABD0YKL5_9HEMI
MLLGALASDITLERYSTPLNRALTHPNKQPKEMALNVLTRAVEEPRLTDLITSDSSVLTNVIGCLCDEELSVGEKAVQLLVRLGQTPAGLAGLCSDAVRPAIVEGTSRSDVNKIRLYQVVIEVGISTPDSLATFKREGFTEQVIGHLSSDDVLSRLAILEELTRLAVVKHGFEFLRTEGVFKLLVEQIKECRDHPLATIVYPGLLKFFGSVGHEFPDELLNNYPEVIEALLEAVDSEDCVITITALETVGFVATSVEGKALLSKLEDKSIRHVLNRMSEASSRLANEWRIRALFAMANVLHVELEESVEELTKISELWYGLLGGDEILANLLGVAKQPFPEMKSAALQVIKEVAGQPWGVTKIVNCPGLVDFLLDRSTESSLEGARAKYEVVKALVECSVSEGALDELTKTRLNEFITQGPCHEPRSLEVALEGQPH